MGDDASERQAFVKVSMSFDIIELVPDDLAPPFLRVSFTSAGMTTQNQRRKISNRLRRPCLPIRSREGTSEALARELRGDDPISQRVSHELRSQHTHL